MKNCKLCRNEGYVIKSGNIPCKSCKETGIFEKTCPACNGTGQYKTKTGLKVFCRKCKGTGIWSAKCNKCDNGVIRYKEYILCPVCKGKSRRK